MTDLDLIHEMIATTRVDWMPRAVATFTADGVEVTVVEPVLPRLDQAAKRGHVYHAITGPFVLIPAGVDYGTPTAGTFVLLEGGRELANAATAGLAAFGARRTLADEATGARA